MGKDTTKPLVTVLTPTYKRPDLLVKTIESVLGQTYRNFVYVIGTDGRHEETEKAVLEYMKKDGRLFYLNGLHVGQFENINRLLTWVTTRYVAILSDDDLWEPEFLEHCVAALEKEPRAALAYTDWGRLFDTKREPVIESRRCNLTLKGLRSACLVNTTCSVISKAALDEVREKYGYHYEPRIRYTCGDWSLWLRLWFTGRQFIHIHKDLATYRVHPQQMTACRPLLASSYEEYIVRRLLAKQELKEWLPAVFGILTWPILVRMGWPKLRRLLSKRRFGC